MKSIAVSVSTIREKEDRVRDFFRRNAEALARFDQVILVMQGCSYEARPAAPPNNLRDFIFDCSKERGLSRSRNRALELCSCDYLWILDDDVIIDPLACDKIRDALNRFQTDDVLTFEFADIVDRKTPAKQYPPIRRLTRLELLRVSSIEMVISARFAKENNLRFNISYGLGAWFPSGEETVFLLDMRDTGAQIVHIDQVIVFHPLAGRNVGKFWRMPRRLYGMGTIARRFGVAGLALVFRWTWRGVRNRLPAPIIVDLFRGYFLNKAPKS